MHQANRLAQILLKSPILWGLFLSVGFFTLVHSGSLRSLPGGSGWEAFLLRYTAGHEIEYVETGMFFIALAALVLKALDVAAQKKLSREPLLAPASADADDCPSLLARLEGLTEAARNSYLARRLHSALSHVQRTGSADTLDEHLKYLADVDAARSHAGYAFVRILIWAIPIMGFLGTVVGITIAIANLSPEALVESLPEVTFGLGVAFDTTALALVLATILMFAQLLVDQQEGRLLDDVEVRVAQELDCRFERLGGGSDPNVAVVRRMAEALLKSTEQTVRRQAGLWHETIEAAQTRWSETATAAQKQLETALAAALDRSLQTHAAQVGQAGKDSLEHSRTLWSQVQRTFDRVTDCMLQQQRELSKQGEVLLKVVEQTGQVATLEDALNRNLSALAGSQNFEETVGSLAAVIHLLNARLSHLPAAPHVVLSESRTMGQAA